MSGDQLMGKLLKKNILTVCINPPPHYGQYYIHDIINTLIHGRNGIVKRKVINMLCSQFYITKSYTKLYTQIYTCPRQRNYNTCIPPQTVWKCGMVESLTCNNSQTGIWAAGGFFCVSGAAIFRIPNRDSSGPDLSSLSLARTYSTNRKRQVMGIS